MCCLLPPPVQDALRRQSRPTADELGLTMDPFTDSMSDLNTLDLRLEYVAAMMQGVSGGSCSSRAGGASWGHELAGVACC